MSFSYEFNLINLRLQGKTLTIGPKFELDKKVDDLLGEQADHPASKKDKPLLNASLELETRNTADDKISISASNEKALSSKSEEEKIALVNSIKVESACDDIRSLRLSFLKSASGESKILQNNKPSKMAAVQADASYHVDDSDPNKKSFHFEFSHMPSEKQFETILDKLHTYAAITEDEQLLCTQKYKEFLTQLDVILDEKNPLHTKISCKASTIKAISQCDNNETLLLWHSYLLSEKFNYLRALTGKIKITSWQGTNPAGKIDKTSGTWARIEKAIALQVNRNLANDNSFDVITRRNHALQLAKKDPFLSIKRKRLTSFFTATSKSFDRVLNSNQTEFNKAYESYFKKYR